MEEVHSASQVVKGLHRFTLEGYSQYKGIWRGVPVYSGTFTVGGYEWAIAVYPNGTFSEMAKEVPQVCVGIRVCLLSHTNERITSFLSITLFDQTGQGNHRSLSSFPNSNGPPKFATNQHIGFPTFITQEALADSCYLKDDCLKIECRLAILLPSHIKCPMLQCDYNDDDDGNVSYFRAMLERGEGCDITIHVGRRTFEAHKVILKACSSYFSKLKCNNQHEKMFLPGIEPHIFKVVLHFIYTDALPENERFLLDGYAFGPCLSTSMEAKLLAAANEFGLIRLKRICESYLWRSIDFNRLAETLALADRCNASELKQRCAKFAKDNIDALKKRRGSGHGDTSE